MIKSSAMLTWHCTQYSGDKGLISLSFKHLKEELYILFIFR